MPDDPVRRRSRRAAKRIERPRRKALAAPTRKAGRYDHRRRPARTAWTGIAASELATAGFGPRARTVS